MNTSEINKSLFTKGRKTFVHDSSKDFEILELEDDEGKTLLAQFHKHDEKSANIIFFPSTTTPLSEYEEMGANYVAHGMNLMVVSYRTDNRADSELNLENFFADGRTICDQAFAWLTSKGLEGAKFIMGQSLGSVIAIDIVANNPEQVKGLLLESSMCQTADYLKNFGLSFGSEEDIESQGFGNIEKIEKIKIGTLIFHGAKDELIPIADAEKLQACCGARTKQFFIIPGAGHEYLYRSGGKLYFETIKKFIDTLCGVNTWRQKRRKFKDSQGK